MESEPRVGTLQEESSTQAARYQKRSGCASTSGQDYEVALCCLFFLRALRNADDFLLACNHDLAGKFDDVVLFYRLKGGDSHEYRAILLQAKHKKKQTEDKLTAIFPFRLQEYFQSFKNIKNLWEQPLKVGDHETKFKEIMIVLYTNAGCFPGEAAIDVTDHPEMHDFLNTGGRLLRITDTQQVGLPQGPETSEFLRHLLLCTEQVSVKSADKFLEQEFCNVLKMTSTDVARKLSSELKRVVKEWWSEEKTGSYLTAESEEWIQVLQMQVTRLNNDTLIVDRDLNLVFTKASLEDLDVVSRRIKMTWVSVTDKYHAKAVRARIFRALKNSLVVGIEYVEGNLEEVKALWGKKVCQTLALDMSECSQDEGSLVLLQRLQTAVQSGSGKNLVVISEEKPATAGWNVIEAVATWSVLDHVTRGRLLKVPLELQGYAVALRDIVGSDVSGIMSEQVIKSLSACETAIKLGESMPSPHEYYVNRCLQRTPSQTIHFRRLQNTNTLFFSKNDYFSSKTTFKNRFQILFSLDLKRKDTIEGPTYVRGKHLYSEIRKLCSRFCVRGISGTMDSEVFTGNVTEFIPFTWMCEEKIVVVEGLPGVGKSSFVSAMCFSVKKQFPEAWVLRIDMGRHSEYIKEKDFRNSSDIKEFLLKGLPKDLLCLERHLLEHSLHVTGNVFLFLDAFDEISPDFTDKCCDLLKRIAQVVTFRQMVVTTRPVATKDVQEALQTEAFILPLFSDEEQSLFLERFSEAKGKKIDEGEIYSLRQTAGQVLEIPLLCKMAAEVLLYHQDQILLKYVNPWRKVLLYNLFVEQSVKERIAEKLGLEAFLPGVKKLLESNQKQHLQNLQGLAVRKLMPIGKLSTLYVSTEMPEEKLGLVVDAGGTVEFEHQTFAEYFFGCWLADHWQRCPKELLRDIFSHKNSEFVAATLSWSLFKDLPLHMAVAQGDEDAVREELSSRTTDRGGRSALHVAAMTRGIHLKVLDLLVASGEDINRKDDVLISTAVTYAEMAANWGFIDFMLPNGATLDGLKFVTDVNAAKQVLIYGMEEVRSDLCLYILRLHEGIIHHTYDDKGNTLLHLAAAYNIADTMRSLKEMERDVNLQNYKGRSPLRVAWWKWHITAYIQTGDGMNIKNNYGETALMLAASKGHLELVRLLVQSGADSNIKKKFDGETALMLAAREGHLDVVRLLITSGADPNIQNDDRETALMLTAGKGHLEVIRLLLWSGAHPNIQNDYGETALMLAAREGHLEVVKELIENEADPNITKNNGNTSLMEAARQDQLKIINYLLMKDADPYVKNAAGETVFEISLKFTEINF